jgi:peptidyl-prolyl cis-trans isomerase D
MLDVLRKRKRSWIITFLLGLIIVVFVAFYGGNQFRDEASQDVAEVNGDIITQREFAIHYQRALERYRDLLKGSLTPELEKNLRGTLLEELIQKRLVLQEARNLGLATTDEDLMIAIAQVPDFQVNGRFNKERYLQLLRANRITPAQFEEEQREQLTVQRLYSIILDGVQVTEGEVRDRYRIEQERINLTFIRLALSNYLAEVKPTEEEIKKFYERNKESLKEPLKVQVEYLSYPFERFSSAVQISDKEIEDYYQANRGTKFHHAKEAKLRYILVRVAPGADAQQKSDAQARANRILAAARAGKDFAQLAKQESDDATSAKGGDIGWLTQGQLPAPLDKTVFSLAKGEISSAIETSTGFHIVKVEDIREEKTESLKDAMAEITRALKAEKGKREAAKTADLSREKALSGSDFTKVAQESGTAVAITRLFTSGETLPEIGQAPEFYKTALSLKSNEVSPVIEGTNAYYLLRIRQRIEATVPPLDTVRSNIEKSLKESKAHEMMLQKAKGLLDHLKKEKDIAKLAQQNNLRLEETGWFLRNASQLPKIGELSEAKTGGIALSAQKPFPDKIYTQKDAAYILAFKDSQGADMERFAKEKEMLTNQATAESRQQVLQKFVENLKTKAEIQVHLNAFEAS